MPNEHRKHRLVDPVRADADTGLHEFDHTLDELALAQPIAQFKDQLAQPCVQAGIWFIRWAGAGTAFERDRNLGRWGMLAPVRCGNLL